MYNLQRHQRPVALKPYLCAIGGLKIPLVGKSVGLGFMLTNCHLMEKTRQFRHIHDRQYKSSRKSVNVRVNAASRSAYRSIGVNLNANAIEQTGTLTLLTKLESERHAACCVRIRIHIMPTTYMKS